MFVARLLNLACGSLISRFWKKMLIASWLRSFGLTGGIADPGLLSNLAQPLKSKVNNGVMSCIGPYMNTLSEIVRIDHGAAKGAQVSAWIQWVEEGETSSAFFSRLGKKQIAVRWVSALRGSDGVVFSDMDGIQRVLSSFYSSLFSAEDVDLAAQDSFLGNLVSSLSFHSCWMSSSLIGYGP